MGNKVNQQKYIVVYSHHLSVLIDTVNSYIEQGYTPLGSPFMDPGQRYCQALTYRL